jgi:tetratricopeptide (TPR) repeat protein
VLHLTILGLLLTTATPALSQDSWSWPEKPENLQVLPKDWTGARLGPVMKGFTRSLGVRCSYCHIGEEGKPLSTFDFASDKNPNKDRARAMLKMLGDINKHLETIERSGDEPVNVWCHTCHRGRPRPMTLAEELGAVYRADGLEATLARYSELKQAYYGRGAYDFGESSLNAFGYELLGKGDVQSAVAVFKLNTEAYPNSANAWDSLAEATARAGDTPAAISYYRKSLELNPNNPNARTMLETLSFPTSQLPD